VKGDTVKAFDLVAHLYRQRAFSRATFGPGLRTKGVVDHIRKELIEIEAAPHDIKERVDLVLLALDSLWRWAQEYGVSIEVVVGAIGAKQSENELRDWPDWRTADPDKAIEHVRPNAYYSGFLCCSPCATPDLCRAVGGCQRA
jgi:hypothetical protein